MSTCAGMEERRDRDKDREKGRKGERKEAIEERGEERRRERKEKVLWGNQANKLKLPFESRIYHWSL